MVASDEAGESMGRDEGGAGRSRGFEPWPWIVTVLLVSMIGISVGFLMIAIHHPDPVVAEYTR